MKHVKIHTRIIHSFLSTAILVITGCMAVSCTDDPVGHPDVEIPAGDTDVRLTITSSGSSTPRATTRAVTDPENTISDVMLLVFNREGSGYTFSYMVEGQQLGQNTSHPQKTDFTAKLKTSVNPFKIIFVANANEVFTSYRPVFGSAEEEVRKKIATGFSGGNVSSIPMYGEKIMASLDAKEVNRIDVKLLRSLARVDVGLDLDREKSKDFDLQSVYIYRANDRIQAAPDQSVMAESETMRVKAPSVPEGTGPLSGEYFKLALTPGATVIEGLYLSESKHYTDAVEMQLRANCVVVGGIYNGESTPTYYRIDFDSGLEGHPFGQVLRNHQYIFTIRQVTGSGWETPEEAANNRSTTIVADIQTWEDFTTGMFVNGDNYFGIDNRELIFGYKADLTKRIGVQSTVPYKIYWDGFSETTGEGGDPVSNGYFSAQVVTIPGDPDEKSYIRMTTLQENMSLENYTAVLRVEWANWKFKVDVTQLHFIQHITRSVKVLSYSHGATGALGYPDQTTANGGTMRRKLSNGDNFSPRGTVDFFAGFAFSQTPVHAWTNSTQEGNTYAGWLTAEVYGADVVYLANHNHCTPWAARMILDWLEASPNRVLIVGGDHNETSSGFLLPSKNGLLLDDVDWWFNKSPGGVPENIQYLSGAGRYFKYLPNDQNKEFFNDEAWFPNVDTSVGLYVIDDLFGYAKELLNEDVIPLIGHTNGDQPVLAINKKRRIIYFGDATLFEYNTNQPYMMTAANTITNNHDKFFGNLWAWIAHQVIWGDDELVETN